jgi:hypothetical protein
MMFVTLSGGPYDGERRAIPGGYVIRFPEPSGVVHVYRAGRRENGRTVWDYDLEGSALETIAAEQKRSDRKPREV